MADKVDPIIRKQLKLSRVEANQPSSMQVQVLDGSVLKASDILKSPGRG